MRPWICLCVKLSLGSEHLVAFGPFRAAPASGTISLRVIPPVGKLRVGVEMVDWRVGLLVALGSGALTTIAVYLLARFTTVFRSSSAAGSPLKQRSHSRSALNAAPGGDTDVQSRALAREFTWLHMASDRNFATVGSFRRVNLASLPTSREMFLNDLMAWFASVLPKAVLDAKAPEQRVPIRELLGEITAEMMLSDAKNATDAAALVFAHSILDDVATQCCRIAARIAPDQWEPSVSERKLTLSDLKGFGSYNAALRHLVERYLADLEGKSVVTRIRILNQRCQPAAHDFPGLPDFNLDLERIESLDRRRQDVIHRVRLRESLADVDSDITYLHNTCHYLMALVSFRYGVTVDPGCMDDLIEDLGPSEGSELDLSIRRIVEKARS